VQLRTFSIFLLTIAVCDVFPRCGLAQSQQPEAVHRSIVELPTVVTLNSRAFPELPRAVRKYLDSHHIGIIEVSGRRGSRNVIRGRFLGGRTRDWAIVGSRDGVSDIYVFAGGSTAHVVRLARGIDNHTRVIALVPLKELQGRCCGAKADESGLNHDGISESVGGNPPQIWFYRSSGWLQLDCSK